MVHLDIHKARFDHHLLHPFTRRNNPTQFSKCFLGVLERKVRRPVLRHRLVVRKHDCAEFAEFEPPARFKVARTISHDIKICGENNLMTSGRTSDHFLTE